MREPLAAERDDLRVGRARARPAASRRPSGARPSARAGPRRRRTPAPRGGRTMVCSTSIDEMFSPPEMMMSLPRSRSSMLPSGCHTARSPEWNQPPRNAVAGGLGVVEVARHDVVAAHDHLAHRLAVAGDVASCRSSTTRTRSADRVAPGPDGRAAAARSAAGSSSPVRLPGAHGVRAVGLGQPVHVDRRGSSSSSMRANSVGEGGAAATTAVTGRSTPVRLRDG